MATVEEVLIMYISKSGYVIGFLPTRKVLPFEISSSYPVVVCLELLATPLPTIPGVTAPFHLIHNLSEDVRKYGR